MTRNKASIGHDHPRSSAALSGASRDEAAYQDLYTAIVENHLEPGTKLPEDTLAEAFGISRTGVRKVLQRLSYQRLVDIRVNRGATVAQPTIKEARDIFAARRIVECGVIGLVAEKASADKLAALAEIVTREHQAEARGDRREAIQLSGEFHVALSRVAENEAVTEMLIGLVSRSSLVIATYGGPRAGSCRHSEHSEVLELLAAGAVEGARNWMDRHLRDIERSVVLVDEGPAAPDLKKVLDELSRRQRHDREASR